MNTIIICCILSPLLQLSPIGLESRSSILSSSSSSLIYKVLVIFPRSVVNHPVSVTTSASPWTSTSCFTVRTWPDRVSWTASWPPNTAWPARDWPRPSARRPRRRSAHPRRSTSTVSRDHDLTIPHNVIRRRGGTRLWESQGWTSASSK